MDDRKSKGSKIKILTQNSKARKKQRIRCNFKVIWDWNKKYYYLVLLVAIPVQIYKNLIGVLKGRNDRKKFKKSYFVCSQLLRIISTFLTQWNVLSWCCTISDHHSENKKKSFFENVPNRTEAHINFKDSFK